MPAEELERAKLAAISSVYMNLESRAVVAEDIGRQILTYGHRCCRPSHPLKNAISDLLSWDCINPPHLQKAGFYQAAFCEIGVSAFA